VERLMRQVYGPQDQKLWTFSDVKNKGVHASQLIDRSHSSVWQKRDLWILYSQSPSV